MKVVILAGGGGTRLFPLSRKCRPKQFLALADEGETLLSGTIKRFCEITPAKDIILVTNQAYYHHVKSELAASGAQEAHIVLEPEARNTAPAIVLAAQYAKDELGIAEDEVFFITPSDHMIQAGEAFKQAAEAAAALAAQGKLVTFGVKPLRPETGFGYIEAGQPFAQGYKIKAFKEKPDAGQAEKYLAAGTYYWNAGMYVFSLRTYREELEKYAPGILAAEGIDFAATKKNFAKMPSISIDYAIAEKSQCGIMLPLDLAWNDVGSWDAIYDVLPKDEAGNALQGDCVTIDCEDNLLLGSSRLIAGIGLKNIMVVETADVILVAQKGESQKVKELVASLKAAGRKEAEQHTTLYYPWGHATVLGGGKGYRMKRLTVDPGEGIPLRRHYHRSVHWIVTCGTAEVDMGGQLKMVLSNESVFIPMTMFYGIKNPGHMPLIVIEVQNGEYLGDDDVEVLAEKSH